MGKQGLAADLRFGCTLFECGKIVKVFAQHVADGFIDLRGQRCPVVGGALPQGLMDF